MVGVQASVEAEHGEQSGIHSPLLFGCQMTNQTPEPPYVDGPGLFDEHASSGRIDLDLGSE